MRGSGLTVAAAPDEAAGAEVMVDFTVAKAARDNLRWCADHGVHAVCGTTGFDAADLESLRSWFSGGAHAIVAPNFSIGAALMMRCAELCAPFVAGAEIIELHHDRKREMRPRGPPSRPPGACRRPGRGRERGLGRRPDRDRDGARSTGGTGAGGLHVHSVRLPGFVAHQEVIFGLMGETLSVRHDSLDRVSFMPGVLLAVRRVAESEGLTIGLGSLLGL